MADILAGKRVGFAMTGSFCTFAEVFPVAQEIADAGAEVFPILSSNAYGLDTRFFPAAELVDQRNAVSGRGKLVNSACHVQHFHHIL